MTGTGRELRAAGRAGRWRAGVLAAVALLLPQIAAADIVAVFDPLNSVFLDPSDTLTVSLEVDAGAIDLRGVSLTLEFDSTVVKPVAVEAGSLFTAAACDEQFFWLNDGITFPAAIGDSIAVDGVTLGCSMQGPGELVTMRFVAVAVGTSPLRCRRFDARNSLNQMIATTCAEATIAFPPIPVESISWGRTKALYTDRRRRR